MSLISEVTGYIADGAIHALDAYRSGFGAPENDPPPATPSTVIYEGGMVKLRYYAARGICDITRRCCWSMRSSSALSSWICSPGAALSRFWSIRDLTFT